MTKCPEKACEYLRKITLLFVIYSFLKESECQEYYYYCEVELDQRVSQLTLMDGLSDRWSWQFLIIEPTMTVQVELIE